MLSRVDELGRDSRLEPLQDWQWWLRNPASALVGLYVCGFVAQNSYLAGFRFISTDLLDKNYLLSGLLCFVVIAVNYFFAFQATRLVLSENPYGDDTNALYKAADWCLNGGFNLACAAWVLSFLTTNHGGFTMVPFWAALIVIQMHIKDGKLQYLLSLAVRGLGATALSILQGIL